MWCYIVSEFKKKVFELWILHVRFSYNSFITEVRSRIELFDFVLLMPLNSLFDLDTFDPFLLQKLKLLAQSMIPLSIYFWICGVITKTMKILFNIEWVLPFLSYALKCQTHVRFSFKFLLMSDNGLICSFSKEIWFEARTFESDFRWKRKVSCTWSHSTIHKTCFGFWDHTFPRYTHATYVTFLSFFLSLSLSSYRHKRQLKRDEHLNVMFVLWMIACYERDEDTIDKVYGFICDLLNSHLDNQELKKSIWWRFSEIHFGRFRNAFFFMLLCWL